MSDWLNSRLKNRALLLLFSLLAYFIYFAYHEYIEVRNTSTFESYINDSSFCGTVTQIGTVHGIYRIKFGEEWFYPDFQKEYLKHNLKIGDSISKQKGKALIIYNFVELK
ncbi:MAG: hypothetical protein KDC05_01500 [Bacteroidales bacterium]|nr:hypothetical protein [Bacteroidales bacterium]